MIALSSAMGLARATVPPRVPFNHLLPKKPMPIKTCAG